jgi:hypothetical protein
MSWRARRRLELHAEECPECSLGVRAIRALLRLLGGSAEPTKASAPEGVFDRVRADAAGTETNPEGAGEE